MQTPLPSIISLRCFAAFARHLSVTRAAAELHLTQSAVSRQIKNLEITLGCILVTRVKQRLFLTADGSRYAKDIQSILEQLAVMTSSIRSVHKSALRVGVEPSFATRWLLPRIQEWWKLHPDSELELMNDIEHLYQHQETFDVGILYGDGNWPELDAWRLFDDELLAVCTPELQRQYGMFDDYADILHYPLIHHISPTAALKSSTQLWLEHIGLGSKDIGALPGQRLEHFQCVLDAALHGLGLTVLPRFFVETELAQGFLVKAYPRPLVCGSYYLVSHKQSEHSSMMRFVDWLKHLPE